jgi:predicted DNA binding CopG/RHH family protein
MSRKRINLSVSNRLYAAVKARADSIGVPVTSYVTTLLVVDVNPPDTTRAGVRSAKEGARD